MSSDSYSEIAILLHHKIPQWNQVKLIEFVREMAVAERELTAINSRLFTSLNTDDLKAREHLKNHVREIIFNTGIHDRLGAYSFETNPADAAIKIKVGKNYSNHSDLESLTFKITHS